MKKRFISIFLIGVFFGTILLTIPALADTSVTVDPQNPTPGGAVTFTVTFSEDEPVSDVVIYVEECEAGLCFTDNFNETMTSIGNSVYEKTITLRHDTAIELKYRVGYSTPTGWVWYPPGGPNARSEVNLDTSGGGNGDNGGNNGTPGFEAVLLFIAVIFISFIVVKRRR